MAWQRTRTSDYAALPQKCKGTSEKSGSLAVTWAVATGSSFFLFKKEFNPGQYLCLFVHFGKFVLACYDGDRCWRFTYEWRRLHGWLTHSNKNKGYKIECHGGQPLALCLEISLLYLSLQFLVTFPIFSCTSSFRLLAYIMSASPIHLAHEKKEAQEIQMICPWLHGCYGPWTQVSDFKMQDFQQLSRASSLQKSDFVYFEDFVFTVI